MPYSSSNSQCQIVIIRQIIPGIYCKKKYLFTQSLHLSPLCPRLLPDVTPPLSAGTTDLLSGDFEPDDTDTDDLALLNEILNAPSAGGEDEFSQEWQAVFGSTLTPQTTGAGAGGDQSGIAEFLPSNLLDNTLRQRMAAGQGNTAVCLLFVFTTLG